MKFNKIIFLGLILALTSCKIWHTTTENAQKYQVEAATVGEDSTVLAMIEPYRIQMADEINAVIGKCAVDLKRDKPESLLTNWVADAIQQKTDDYFEGDIDFAVSNYGGIRIPVVAAGDITRGKIFELMPFDNMLVVVEMADTTVLKLFNHMAADNGWPISSGAQYEIKNQTAQNILIHGKPIQKGKTYAVAVSDYLANGGDKCYFLQEGKRTDLNLLIRDALILYVEDTTAKGLQVTSKLDGRLKYVD